MQHIFSVSRQRFVDFVQDFDIQPDFFFNLAHYCGIVRFAGLDFATNKTPETWCP